MVLIKITSLFKFAHIFSVYEQNRDEVIFLNKKEYDKLVKESSPPSKVIKDCAWAFFVGGVICIIGQALSDFYKYIGLNKDLSSSATSITLVGLSIFLTALTIYERLASKAGAGTLVPITGFANAMSSPAIEFKTEGFVLGVGANLFKIAGPVIVYGTVASVLYGIIYWLCKMI